MADNILKGIIQIEARGVAQTTTQVSTAINKTEQSLKKVVPASNQATLALGNLGRVAQDAPFGFLGIANNLNPLLESFQRLKVSTGTTGGALKALAGSLTGAGGIGLALSVASSLAIVFGDRLFGTSKAAKAAKEANDELAKSITGDLTKLTVLVGIINNVNTSNDNRVKALKLINQEYLKYLPNIDKEGVTVSNLAKSYGLITEALLRQAVVKGIQKEIEEEITKTATEIIKLQKAEENRRIASERANKVTVDTGKAIDKAAESYNKFNTPVKDGQFVLIRQRNEIERNIDTVGNYDNRIKSLTESLKKQLAPLLNLTTNFNDLDETLKIIKPKKIKVDKKELRPDLGSIQIELPTIFDTERADTRSRFRKQLDDLENSINLKIPVTLDLSKPGKSFQNAVSKGLKDVGDLADAQQQKIRAFANVVTDTLSPAFQSFFSTVASGGNAFKAFAQAAVQALTGLITKLITTAILALIVSSITGGGVAIGAAAPGKFGDIFKFLSGFGGARAGGGPVSGGKSYLVGENGPEIFNPGVNGSIVPNNRVSSFGMGSSGGRVVFEISGNKLIGVLANGNRSQKRLV
jgi:transposase-like protein